jgi:hypothetical protein
VDSIFRLFRTKGTATIAAMLTAGEVAAVTQDKRNSLLPPFPAMLVDRSANLRVDGALDEDAWRSAPMFDAFHQFLPTDGKRAIHHRIVIPEIGLEMLLATAYYPLNRINRVSMASSQFRSGHCILNSTMD